MGHSRLNWSSEQQEMLKTLKQESRTIGWKYIAELLNKKFPQKLRTPKQCRQRYMNYVKFKAESPKIETWTPQQDEMLFHKFRMLGSRWVLISYQMPGRSQNSLKNRFYGILRRVMRRIEKICKQKKVKHRKSLKLQVLVQILEPKNELKKFGVEFEENNQQTVQFLKELSNLIIQIGINREQLAQQQQLKQLVVMLNDFISKTRLSKKKKDQTPSCQNFSTKLFQKQSTFSNKVQAQDEEISQKLKEKNNNQELKIGQAQENYQNLDFQLLSLPYNENAMGLKDDYLQLFNEFGDINQFQFFC